MISTTELSKQLYIAPIYIHEVAKKLKDANIIVACEGVKGGYTLAKRAEDISLKEIVSCEEELDKKYQKDLEYRLSAGTLSSEEEDEVANILGLNDTDDLRVVTFRLLPKNKSGRFTSEQLRQTEIVEKELLRNLPKKYTTSNTNQIIYIYKKDEQISNLQFRLGIEELQKIIQNNLDKRSADIDFLVGIGKDVKGYSALKESFSDSKTALKYIHVIRKIIGDEDKSVVDCSKLGFFRTFVKISDKEELLSYVPESLQKLYEFDKQKNG
ncbi:Rrf2 family transcriptional regulator, partial [Holdemanella biformis]